MTVHRLSTLTCAGRRAARHLALAALCLAACAAAHAGLTLELRVATHHEASPGATNVPPDSVETEQVVLGEHYISIKSGKHATILDFATRRRYVIDLPGARYVDYSLFDTLGFRVQELQNRQGLARIMAAAKVSVPAMDALDHEQSLSLLSKPGEQLDETPDGADIAFAIDGKALLRRSAAGTPVSAADAAKFVNYLRYTAGGHPLVLDKLLKARQIPQRLTFSYRDVGGSLTRDYQLDSISMTAPASYDLHPYTQGSSSGDEVTQVLDQARALALSAQVEVRRAAKEHIARAFAEQRPLDAMLGTAEYALMTGETPAPFSPEQQTQLQGDPVVQQAHALLGARDKAGLTAAIPALRRLRQQTMSKRHMLVLFEANDLVQLGDLKAAKPMFVSVLRANPWLAGTYKDLGDLLFREFDMAGAWRCWDAGRRIAPQLAMLAAVSQFEATLLQQHPEYF